MAKELHCRDVGFDCDAVVVAESDDQIVQQVAEHAREVHGLTDEQLTDPAQLELVQSNIREHNESA